MDGGSAENAGAFFSLAKGLPQSVSRVELAPTITISNKKRSHGLRFLLQLYIKITQRLTLYSTRQYEPLAMPAM